MDEKPCSDLDDPWCTRLRFCRSTCFGGPAPTHQSLFCARALFASSGSNFRSVGRGRPKMSMTSTQLAPSSTAHPMHLAQTKVVDPAQTWPPPAQIWVQTGASLVDSGAELVAQCRSRAEQGRHRSFRPAAACDILRNYLGGGMPRRISRAWHSRASQPRNSEMPDAPKREITSVSKFRTL